jgi:Tfp pilus assembly major pilin PilA
MRHSKKVHFKAQKGMTFWSTLVVIAALVLLGTVGIKTFPYYIEFNAVKTAVKKLGTENLGEMTRKDVVDKFDRQASATYIETIKGNDLHFEGGVVTAEYQKVIPLFWNISILLDFSTSTAK